MPRWNEEETELLRAVRERLGSKLTERPQFPEVVGDRKLIRFLRGHDYVIDKVVEMVENFLAWRDENKVDDIRRDIVDGGLDCAKKFPNGLKILELVPQVVLDRTAVDISGNPVSSEGLIPPTLWESVTTEEYIRFRIYCLEFVSLALEQISHEKEILIRAEKGEDFVYGFIQQLQVVRDVSAVSLMNFAGNNREVVGKVTQIASNNYPEVLLKCRIVNAPWIFGTIYAFVKMFLAQKTIDKIELLDSSFLDSVTAEIPISSLPDFIGGTYRDYNVPWEFDKSEGGPLFHSAAIAGESEVTNA